MTCAERVRRHRQRQRDGRVVLCIEAEEVALIDKLIVARLLDPTMADDPQQVVAAVTRLLEIFSRDDPS
jgi:hypothetical protein